MSAFHGVVILTAFAVICPFFEVYDVKLNIFVQTVVHKYRAGSPIVRSGPFPLCSGRPRAYAPIPITVRDMVFGRVRLEIGPQVNRSAR